MGTLRFGDGCGEGLSNCFNCCGDCIVTAGTAVNVVMKLNCPV